MYELRRSDGYIPFCLTFYSVFFYDFSVDTSLYSLRPYELLRGSLYACLCNAKNIRKLVGIFFVKLNPFTIMLSVPMSEGSLIISTFIFLCMWKLEVNNLTCTTGLDMAVSFLDVSFYWLFIQLYTSIGGSWDIAKHKKSVWLSSIFLSIYSRQFVFGEGDTDSYRSIFKRTLWGGQVLCFTAQHEWCPLT